MYHHFKRMPDRKEFTTEATSSGKKFEKLEWIRVLRFGFPQLDRHIWRPNVSHSFTNSFHSGML
jgi:hypothetical protein